MSGYVLGWIMGTLIYDMFRHARRAFAATGVIGLAVNAALSAVDGYAIWVLVQGGGCK